MATKKPETAPVEEVYDPEELVDVKFPIIPGGRNDDVIIWVNDRSWQVQRGKKVKLPRCAVEVYEHSEEMMLLSEEHIAEAEAEN